MSDTRGLEENLKKAREIALSNKNSTFALNIHNLKEINCKESNEDNLEF